MVELLILFAHDNESDFHIPAVFWMLAGVAILAVLLAMLPMAKRLRATGVNSPKVLFAIAATCIVAGLAFVWVASTNDDEIVTSEAEQQRLQVLREPPMPDVPR